MRRRSVDEVAGWGWGVIGEEVIWSIDVLGVLFFVIFYFR